MEKKSYFARRKEAVEKGRQGESNVVNALTQIYPQSVIKQSGKHKCGDIMFTLKQLKCMIEVKNKVGMQYIDIAKFIRDVIALCRRDLINCAVLLSIDYPFVFDKVPKKGKQFYAELICNIPVVYVCAEDADPDKLKAVIDYLISLPFTQTKPKPIIYKTPETIASKTQAYFEQSEIPADLDEIDIDAFIYIRSVLTNTSDDEDVPVPSDLTKERSKYMILEHLIPKSKLLITSALNMRTLTEKRLVALDILSQSAIEMIKKLDAFDEVLHYCEQNKTSPDVFECP
jgi:hypothetical protein